MRPTAARCHWKGELSFSSLNMDVGPQLLTTELCKWVHLPQARTAEQCQTKKQWPVCELVENPFTLPPLVLVKCSETKIEWDFGVVGIQIHRGWLKDLQQGKGFGEWDRLMVQLALLWCNPFLRPTCAFFHRILWEAYMWLSRTWLVSLVLSSRWPSY